jgi:hypothetical protein
MCLLFRFTYDVWSVGGRAGPTLFLFIFIFIRDLKLFLLYKSAINAVSYLTTVSFLPTVMANVKWEQKCKMEVHEWKELQNCLDSLDSILSQHPICTQKCKKSG